MRMSRLVALAIITVLLIIPFSHLVRIPRVEAQTTWLGIWSPTYGTYNITIPDLPAGTLFIITVNVTQVTELAAFDVEFTFTLAVIELQNICDNAGNDPCDESNELSFGDVFSGLGTQDLAVQAINLLGEVHVARSVLGGGSFTGNGILFRVPFKVAGTGSTQIIITTSEMLDVNFNTIVPEIQNGLFNNTGKTPPVALFTWTWTDSVLADGRITVGEVVRFNGTESYDPDAAPGSVNKGIRTYRWTWGDGTGFTSDTQPFKDHVFRGPTGAAVSGNFTVTLTVTDADGLTGERRRIVSVSPLPSHGVRVSLALSQFNISPGTLVTVSVTLTNLSTEFDETVSFTVTYDTTVLWSQDNIPLNAQNARPFTYSWDTGNLAVGNYEVTVTVPPVPEETLLNDNTFTTTLSVQEQSSSSLPVIAGGIFAFIAVVALLYILARRREKEEPL